MFSQTLAQLTFLQLAVVLFSILGVLVRGIASFPWPWVLDLVST
jgi:hypothetical protein